MMDLSSALVDAAVTIVAKDYSLTLVLLPLVCLSCPSSLSALKVLILGIAVLKT